jgi:glucose-1-phosphate thymidylyltransferase
MKPEIKSKIQDLASIQGRVSIGENTTIKNGAIIRGPTILGNNSTIEKDVYIGPYTSIGNNTTIKRGEIENSIIMDSCHIDIDDRITDSLIGPNSTITSTKNKPKARRFLIGEQSQITL